MTTTTLITKQVGPEMWAAVERVHEDGTVRYGLAKAKRGGKWEVTMTMFGRNQIIRMVQGRVWDSVAGCAYYEGM